MNKYETLHTLLLGAFDNQDKLNQSLRPDWATAGLPYYRAIWTEVAEAVGHMNWLWWKQASYGTPESATQIADVHVELCDILHFGLSSDIVTITKGSDESNKSMRLDFRARQYQQMFSENRQTTPEFYVDIEAVATSAIQRREFDIEYFARACYAVGLSLEMLLVLYYAKSTLNSFRWANGYKIPKGQPGAYIKMWPDSQGTRVDLMPPKVEDNVILHRMLKSLLDRNPMDEVIEGIADGSFKIGITRRLQAYYDNHVLKK